MRKRHGSTYHPIQSNPLLVSLEFRRRKRFDPLPCVHSSLSVLLYHLTLSKREWRALPNQALELPQIFGMPVIDCISLSCRWRAVRMIRNGAANRPLRNIKLGVPPSKRFRLPEPSQKTDVHDPGSYLPRLPTF